MMLQGDATISMMIRVHMLANTVRNLCTEFSTVISVKELVIYKLQYQIRDKDRNETGQTSKDLR